MAQSEYTLMLKLSRSMIEPSAVVAAKRQGRKIDVASGTLQVIAREGVEGASMRAIAHELKCSTGALTHYFRDKESLLAFTLDVIAQSVAEDLTEVVSAPGGVDGFIDAISRLLSFDETYTTYWRAWFAVTAAAQTSDSLRKLHARRLGQMRNALAKRLKELQATGEASRDVVAAEEAAALTSFIDGLGLHALISPEAFPAKRRRALLDAFCTRWRSRERPRQNRRVR